MNVKQIWSDVNPITTELLGESGVLAEDLSNLVDVGETFENTIGYEKFTNAIVNKVGKTEMVNRVYEGTAPSVLIDSWLMGSIREKITVTVLPEAEENEGWNDFEDGRSVDPYVQRLPKVSEKFYNGLKTFEIDMTFPEYQIRQSFQSPEQMSAFISMIETAIKNSMTLKLDALIQRTVNKAICDTVYDDYSVDGGPMESLSSKSGIKAVNLLYLYNTKMAALDASWTNLTAEQSITNPGFIRFAAYIMGLYADRLTRMSKLFNIGKLPRFTSESLRHTILLSEFRRAADVYLQSETYHDEYTKLINSEVVPYWQGSGQDYSFTNTSKIIYKTGENSNLTFTGILGVMFDRYALGVSNMDRRTKTIYNPKGEYYNNFYKADAEYFVDGNENVVVFFVA